MLRMELLLTLLLPSRGPEGAPSHLRIGEARDGEAPGTGGQAVSCSPLSTRRGQLDSDSQGQQGGAVGLGPGARSAVPTPPSAGAWILKPVFSQGINTELCLLLSLSDCNPLAQVEERRGRKEREKKESKEEKRI